ncbi:hypothetical protein [Actinokineospora sp. NBRC 105648]|nr:hypothetical protein [Actinokineospora sp. NBRC 105648]GLZ40899.1 hypothetical protein Acsp05_45230 [Actinokineospora sp. NBRC 105648]
MAVPDRLQQEHKLRAIARRDYDVLKMSKAKFALALSRLGS